MSLVTVKTVLGSISEIPAGRLMQPFAFEASAGLYVHQDRFSKQVLGHGSVVEPADVGPTRYADLDEEIPEYGNGGMAELDGTDLALAQIAFLIRAQWDGQAGPLLTDGKSNVLPYGGLITMLNRVTGSHYWFLYFWQRAGFRLIAGSRVFASI